MLTLAAVGLLRRVVRENFGVICLKTGFRGFIGPIGDDIPSIFPIVAGILLFLGTMAYANNALQLRNQELNLRKAALDLSYIVLEKGFLSAGELNALCDASLRPTGDRGNAKFVVLLKGCDQRNSQDPFENVAACSSSVVALNSSRMPDPQPQSYVSLAYPVATDCMGAVGGRGLGIVNVITWK